MTTFQRVQLTGKMLQISVKKSIEFSYISKTKWLHIFGQRFSLFEDEELLNLIYIMIDN